MKWTTKALSPAVITSPSRKVTCVTRRPLTLVPLVLPRSIRWQSGGWFSTWKCLRERTRSCGHREFRVGRAPDRERIGAVDLVFLTGVRAQSYLENNGHFRVTSMPILKPITRSGKHLHRELNPVCQHFDSRDRHIQLLRPEGLGLRRSAPCAICLSLRRSTLPVGVIGISAT